MTSQQLVPIPLDRRWADYFNRCGEFYVDRQHFSFKSNQMAFRGEFGGGENSLNPIPVPEGRYCPVMVPYSKADTPNGLKVLIQQRVYSSCYTRVRELRKVPVGIPPKPKAPSAPADGGEKRKASDI
eukprot:11853094-Alexandrium_andersonii.AAC.1